LRRSTPLWILAVVLTLASATWQRLTGPSHALRVRGEIGGVAVRARLLRTQDTGSDLPVRIELRGATDAGAAAAPEGEVVWRRYPSGDAWSRLPLSRDGAALTAELPAQPAAGKLQYRVELSAGDRTVTLPADRLVVARYKGHVPFGVLLPHILVMFCGMLWSTRAGLEAVAGGARLRRLAVVTCGLLVLGGFVLGPIVQRLAFGAFWTGWPLGEDLTDNKLAIAVLAWVNALVLLRGRRGGRWAVLAASLVTLAVFLIPHSLRGSTLDYETMQTITG
jgi:hypothetical protein